MIVGSDNKQGNKEKTRSSRDVVEQRMEKKSGELVLKEANLERSPIKTIRRSPKQGGLKLSGPPSGRAPVAGLEPETKGSLKNSERIRYRRP
ncbi:hypothetical protein PoB_001445000 [Plakobranchus ocellatus]|uniref:Uncharacterized protein n=1 Tax=Plakobranchus ocellatus TaxID=259542 RepID=A0AAV3YYG4_9GAST|nr:hypothetical protein PoB_001445000 [Plakobranchus ocellatus]